VKLQILTSIEGGKFKRNRNLALDLIASFEGKDVLLTIEKKRRKRSNDQNAFYWGVALPLVQAGLKDATGEIFSAEIIHEEVLRDLRPFRELANIQTGETKNIRVRTSEMTTSEFMDYIAEIQRWSAEFLGINIPNPNEQTTIAV
jgi:hypothetical protein